MSRILPGMAKHTGASWWLYSSGVVKGDGREVWQYISSRERGNEKTQGFRRRSFSSARTRFQNSRTAPGYSGAPGSIPQPSLR